MVLIDVDSKKLAIRLIIIFGIVSLFGDIIYEGTRGIIGPYLKILGANALIVGFVAGLGEFIGYLFRLFSGYFSDKTGAYWFFTFIGYGLIAFIPMLSFANIWQIAGLFIIMERFGKALRSPARDTIISHLTKKVGSGFGFGLHELFDQVGAVIGPLIFAFAFLNKERVLIEEYKIAFTFMWIPFIFLIIALLLAFLFAGKVEKEKEEKRENKLPKIFWGYVIFTFITTFGFISFAISGYHFKSKNIFNDYQIPLIYAFAMAVDGIASIFIGRAYDRMKEKNGLKILLIIPVLTLFSSIFIFSDFKFLVIFGVVLWGVVMGAHETIMRAGISDITPIKRRGTAYGIFNFSYGIAFFLGSSLIGFLYDYSLNILLIFLVSIQIFAVIFFLAKIETNLQFFENILQ